MNDSQFHRQPNMSPSIRHSQRPTNIPDFDEDDDGDFVEDHLLNGFGRIVRFIIMAFLLIMFLDFMSVADLSPHGGQYEVVSVSNGAVQVVDISTGRITEIADPELVQLALEGKILAGQIIRYR